MSCVCVCVDLESSLWNAGATIASGFSRLRGAHASSSTLLTWLWSLGLTQTVFKWEKSCQILIKIFFQIVQLIGATFFSGSAKWIFSAWVFYVKGIAKLITNLARIHARILIDLLAIDHLSLKCSIFRDFNEWNFLVKLHLRKVCKSFKIADMCACVQRNQRRRATNVRSTVFHRRSTNVTTYMSGGYV